MPRSPAGGPGCASPRPYDLREGSGSGSHPMSEPAHHYLTFGTASGFCGIAWNDRGITRFQLPTRSPEAADRLLLRRAPGAEPGAPPPTVAEAIAAVGRYFEGERTDFSGLEIDLDDQDAFFGRDLCRGPAGRVGPHDHLRRLGEGTRRRARGRARRRSGHGEEPGPADHPLPQGPGRRRQDRWLFGAGGRGGQDPHARAGRRSRRALASGPAAPGSLIRRSSNRIPACAGYARSG